MGTHMEPVLERIPAGADIPRYMEELNSRCFHEPIFFPVSMIGGLIDEGKVHSYLIRVDGRESGYTVVIPYGRSVYVWLIAVDECMRGKGVGASTLSVLRRTYPDRILYLDCEPDRMGFYLHAGMKDSGIYNFFLGVEFHIMVFTEVDLEDYEGIMRIIMHHDDVIRMLLPDGTTYDVTWRPE